MTEIITAIMDIKDTHTICYLPGFIQIPEYRKNGIKIVSRWEYGCVKIGEKIIRIYVCSEQPQFIEYLENMIKKQKDKEKSQEQQTERNSL